MLSWTEPCSIRVSIFIRDPGKDEQVIAYLFNSPRQGGKWRMSFLIGLFHFKSSIAVAFWFFEVCAVRFCILGELFTEGSPAEIIVSVGSLGRACTMLEDPTLVSYPARAEGLVNRILFTNPSARAGYDTRSIFKRSLTGLNLEFSFS